MTPQRPFLIPSYPWHLVQCLIHIRCSNILVSEYVKMQGHHIQGRKLTCAEHLYACWHLLLI